MAGQQASHRCFRNTADATGLDCQGSLGIIINLAKALPVFLGCFTADIFKDTVKIALAGESYGQSYFQHGVGLIT